MLIPSDLKKWLKMRKPDCVHSSAILAYVEALEEDAGSKIAEIARLENRIKQFESTQPKWISVEERLPEPFVSVIVYMPQEAPCPPVHEGYRTGDGRWYSAHFVRDLDEVTHWMPLPEPPKEE